MSSKLVSAPEFYAALLLFAIACILLRRSLKTGVPQAFFPEALSAPAVSIVMMLPERYVSWINKALRQADLRYRCHLANFCCSKVYATLLIFIASAYLNVLIAPFAMLLTWFVPDYIIYVMMRRRQQRLRKALPRLLDIMVLCADAGLGLGGIMQRITHFRSKNGSKELQKEFGILAKDLVLGLDKEKAYHELYERTGLEELRALSSVLLQSSVLGISVAALLRTQSDFTRGRLMQDIEEKAHKTPVLMTFPMWFCIMPSLFVVLIAPSLLRAMQMYPWHHSLATQELSGVFH